MKTPPKTSPLLPVAFATALTSDDPKDPISTASLEGTETALAGLYKRHLAKKIEPTHPHLSFAEAIDQHLIYIATERGLSQNYQISIRRSLEKFADWSTKKNLILSPRRVKIGHLSEYLAHEKQRGLAPASLKPIVVAFKIFFRWLKNRELIERDPAEHLRIPKVPEHLPQTLNEQEINKLLSVDLSSRPFPLRDQAILELFYSSGLRISELTNARIENLNLEERVIRVVGKGNKTRLIPIAQPACVAIDQYLIRERVYLVGKGSGDEIFLSRNGKKLTPQRVWQITKEIAASAGFDTNVYPHLLRHSFATHLLGHGADLRVIQELLGHADISTTQIYTRVDPIQLKTLVKRCHPRGSRKEIEQ